jgi:hypothetical protein
MSLALTSAPDELQIVGIDLGGRELAVLDSLPHTVAELATSLDTAYALLAWTNAEMDRRPRDAMGGADMALVVDDLRWAGHAGDVPAAALLGRLSARGWQSGIHILAAGTVEPFAVGRQAARGLAVPGRPGWFDLAAGRERARVRACGLGARELDQAVRRLTAAGRWELR